MGYNLQYFDDLFHSQRQWRLNQTFARQRKFSGGGQTRSFRVRRHGTEGVTSFGIFQFTFAQMVHSTRRTAI